MNFKFYEYTEGDKKCVAAVTTYRGQKVRAVAKCCADDTYSYEKGKALSQARCNAKVCDKQFMRMNRKLDMAVEENAKAYSLVKKLETALQYRFDEMSLAHREVLELERDMMK